MERDDDLSLYFSVLLGEDSSALVAMYELIMGILKLGRAFCKKSPDTESFKFCPSATSIPVEPPSVRDTLQRGR
jgi:hypothetical protein